MGLTLDPLAVQRLLLDPTGPVQRGLYEIAEEVRVLAREKAGRSEGEDHQHLQDSLRLRKTVDGLGYQVGVFESPTIGYALYHHEGTDPHPIDPIPPNKVLVFYYPKAGRVVYLRHVDHPGTRPNPYLTDALAEVRV